MAVEGQGAVVDHPHLRGNGGGVPVDALCFYENAPVLDAAQRPVQQLYLPVKARPRVPPAVGGLGVVHGHLQAVGLSKAHPAGQVHHKGRVAVGVEAQAAAVERDRGVPIHAVELHKDFLPLPLLGDVQGFLIGARAAGEKPRGCVGLPALRQPYLHVVRQVYNSPFRRGEPVWNTPVKAPSGHNALFLHDDSSNPCSPSVLGIFVYTTIAFPAPFVKGSPFGFAPHRAAAGQEDGKMERTKGLVGQKMLNNHKCRHFVFQAPSL